MLIPVSLAESLALSPNEAKIYETLVEQGELSISHIALAAGIHRRNAYDSIHRLLDKGLIFQILGSHENRFNAVDPDKLNELLQEKQSQLADILPTLKQKFHHRPSKVEAYIFKGYEGQKNVFREMLRVGQDVYNIGAKGQWFDPELNASREAFFREAKRKRMTFHLLFDDEIRTQWPEFASTYATLATLKYRYLPKNYSTNSVANIFGEYVVTYTGVTVGKMSDETIYFVLKSADLAASYHKWFEYMWEQSKPEKTVKK